MEELSIWQSMLQNNMVYVSKLPGALVSLAIGYIVLRIARKIITSATSIARMDRALQSIILSIVSFAGWILILAASLSVMELNQLSLALGGSIALIAMALATGLNGVTQDLMAGMFLISDREFTIGRRVKAGAVEGELIELTIRKTKIRDDNGQVHTIPNRTVDGAVYVLIDPKDAEKSEKAG